MVWVSFRLDGVADTHGLLAEGQMGTLLSGAAKYVHTS